MKINLIIPVYGYNKTIALQNVLFPESGLIPAKQVEFIKNFFEDEKTKEQSEVTIITVSPYIAEGFCNKAETVTFSDGKKEIESEDFWKHFAEPMRLMM